jgi:hypothetical protein
MSYTDQPIHPSIKQPYPSVPWTRACAEHNMTYSFYNHGLDPVGLARALHLLRRRLPVEVVDGHVAALFGEGLGEDGA